MNKVITGVLCALCASMPIFAIPASDTEAGIAQYKQDYMTNVYHYFDQVGQKGTFEGKEGVNIAYVKCIAEQEKGAIVILHGKGESYNKYAELVYDLRNTEALSQYSFYLMDSRGHGNSGRMLEDRYKVHVEDFEYYVDDVKTFVDSIVKPETHERLYLIAHSMGGAISTRFLEEYPRVFDKAVLCSPMLKIKSNPSMPELLTMAMAVGAVDFGKRDDWALNQKGDDTKIENETMEVDSTTHSQARWGLQQDLRLHDQGTRTAIAGGAQWGPTWGWLKQSLVGTEKARCMFNLLKIKTPTLIFQAGEDHFVQPIGQNLMDLFAPNSKLIKFNTNNTDYHFEYNSYHEILQEKDEIRDVAISEIVKFLGE